MLVRGLAPRWIPMGVRAGIRRMIRVTRRFRVVSIRSGPAAGVKMSLRLASNDYRTGSIELPVQQAVANELRPDAVFFDIGANIGFFTLLASRVMGGGGTIVAFEARCDVAAVLNSNLRRNGVDAQVWPVAVGERTGIASLLVADHPGGATIEPSRSYDTVRIEHVPLVAIDDLIEAGRLPVPDVVKLDVEGAEPAVIRGMSNTLRLGRTTVIFEIDAPTADRAEAQFHELSEMLCELGEDVTRLAPAYRDPGWHVIHGVARPAALHT